MMESEYNTKLLQHRGPMSVFPKVITFTRKFLREQLRKAYATIINYLADRIVKRGNDEQWIENRTKWVLVGIYDAIAEPIRTGHWKTPRLGNDRTAYVIGLFGTGRLYINELMRQNLGQRAKYIRRRIRIHPGPTSMIYTGHATMKHACRGQKLPVITSRILEAVKSEAATLIFVYRHPLDSLLTNWIWWRTYIREKRMIDSISDVYKSTDDLCAGLEEDFAGFKTFADGDPQFFAAIPGQRFLSFAEFTEETELFLHSATLTLRLEDFMIDPCKEFAKIVKILALDIDLSRLNLRPPRTKPYRYLAVKAKVPRFKEFVDGLNSETKRRIERLGYSEAGPIYIGPQSSNP
jgi:hypothetical protein